MLSSNNSMTTDTRNAPTQVGSILDDVSSFVSEGFTLEGLVLKRLGLDTIPLHDLIANRFDVDASLARDCPEIVNTDDAQPLATLVQRFVSSATSSVATLHKAVESVPPIRPFGGSTSVERLMLENLRLTRSIVDFDNAEAWGLDM